LLDHLGISAVNRRIALITLFIVAAAVLALFQLAPAKQGNLIVVITPSLDNPFFGQEALAAEERARELDYDVVKYSHSSKASLSTLR
jgi:erythritol transport system substrate-binding protein